MHEPASDLGGESTLAGDEHSTAQPERPPTPGPQRGDAVARFVVLERKGGGSMGVVYAAYDPQLDRKVALKLLHPRRSIGPSAAEERRRLLREAQAIARVNHPNVIAIHDVGETGGGVFLAMEYIDGPTLAQWLAPRTRTIAEITAVFIAAGQGLAAAHAKDLVHRDFKPDNVMLDADGRVRVLDFGLVHTANDEAPTPEDGVVGTPAYMAPEQLVGRGVDARSDQFSFCVALYEALYGARPFVGRDLATLGAAISAGVVPPAPAGSAVPAGLRRVVVRGLAVDQQARWPDMNALVDALASARARGRTRTIAVTTIAAVATVGALVVVWRGDSQQALCARLATEADVWAPDRRVALETRVVGDGSAFRRDTWSRVAMLLDARAESLHAATTAACLAAPSDALAGARQLCVARHRRALDATIGALLDAGDVDGVIEATPTVEAIPDAIACDDTVALGDEVAPPAPTIAAPVRAVRDDLARAVADASLGHDAAALALAESALARARALEYDPVIAEAELVAGQLLGRFARYADAEAMLRDAFALAIEVGDDRLAMRVVAALVRLVGDDDARPREGLVWGDVGRALSRRGDWVIEDARVGIAIAAAHERGGDPRAALAELYRVEQAMIAAGREPDGNLLRALTHLHRSLGDIEAARAAIEVALDRDTQSMGPEHPTVAGDIALLGAVEYERGEHAAALEHYHRAHELYERVLAPDDTRLAVSPSNIATAEGARGDYAAAFPALERALAIWTKALGPEHPDTLDTASNLATLYLMRGDTAESIARQLDLLPRFERAFGSDHPNVAGLLLNLGSAETELGRHDDAIAHLERAVAISERSLGDDHIDLASGLFVLGEAYRSGGQPAKAMPLYERSLAIYERRRGPDHADLSWPLLGIGLVALGLGESERAIAVLQRAVALRDASEMPVAERGVARFELARALWTRVDARAEALALARVARKERASDTKAVAEIDAQLDAWGRGAER